MTGGAPSGDGGLQAERTALAWTRTSLAAAVSGGLVVIRDRDLPELSRYPAQLVTAAAAAITAAGLFLLGVQQRRDLIRGSRPNRLRYRREMLTAGAAVLTLILLVVTYLALPLL